MKKAALLFAVLVGTCVTSEAALIEAVFGGTIVSETNNSGGASIISPNAPFTITTVYDTDSLKGIIDPTRSRFFTAIKHQTVTIEGHTYHADESLLGSGNNLGTIFINNNFSVGEDVFSTANILNYNGSPLQGFIVTGANVGLKDSAGTVFNSTDLPLSLDLNDFDTAGVNINFTHASSTSIGGFQFAGVINSLTTTVVPEPSTLTLIASMGFTLGGRRRCRR